jgi:hypothetical protein
MIIVDINQTMIANLMAQIGNHTNVEIQEDMVRHMILNALRKYKQMYPDAGEMVIACDDKKYWRRTAFPAYKANRKKAREESELDWNQIFTILNKIRDELKAHSPYKVLLVNGAEADDIIATLCAKRGKLMQSTEPIHILSGDKDFVQLQIYANVQQFDPVRKKQIKTTDPYKYLREHILKGDRGDGIPNIMSRDNCIVDGERQKSLPAKRIEYLAGFVDLSKVLPSDQLKNFKRNEQLIDLHMIPEDITTAILQEYDTQRPKDIEVFRKYLQDHKLKTLEERIGEF